MLKNKLRSSKGESLVEILASILVCGISILILLTLVNAAMRMNAASRNMDAGEDGTGGFYGALSAAETFDFSSGGDPFTVRVSGTGLSDVSFDHVRSATLGEEPYVLTVYGKEAGA